MDEKAIKGVASRGNKRNIRELVHSIKMNTIQNL